MNDREERTIAAIAELKQEMVQTNLHLGQINGSMAKHFAEDQRSFTETARWQQDHDLRDALIKAALSVREAREEGFKKGLLLPVGIVVAVMSILGPTLARLIVEKLL